MCNCSGYWWYWEWRDQRKSLHKGVRWTAFSSPVSLRPALQTSHLCLYRSQQLRKCDWMGAPVLDSVTARIGIALATK